MQVIGALLLILQWAGANGLLVLLGFGGVSVLIAAYTRKKTNAKQLPDPNAPPRSKLPVGFGRALLQQMPAPLLVISDTGRVVYANPAAERILPPVVTGGHFSTAIRAPAFIEAIDLILGDREDITFRFTLMMEQERHFEARASMLPAGAGDFSDSDQVIVQIEDRTLDKATLQMRSDFIANASHELRTPLASILGYIETLQGHAREDPEAREKFLEIMMKQATRMQRLVEDLMSLSRIEMNAHIRPEDVVDLHRIAIEAASGMFPLATKSDVILQIDIDSEGGPEVIGDRHQLTQVVVNLIDNAIKYGGPAQTVRVAAASEDLRYPGQVGISVIDNGPGISRENIHRLTERFFRVNTIQSKNKGGTGLGLAITKHILNRHSGALDVSSTVGKGSTFTLWVPEADVETT